MLRPSRRLSQGNAYVTNEGGTEPASPLDLNYGGGGAPTAPSAAAAPPAYNHSYATNYGPAASSLATPSYGGYGGGIVGGGALPTAGRAASGGGYSIYKDKPGRQQGNNKILVLLKLPITWGVMVTLLLTWNVLSYRSQVKTILNDLNVKSVKDAVSVLETMRNEKTTLERDYARVKSQERQTSQKFIETDKSLKTLQKERDELKHKLAAAAATTKHSMPPAGQQQQSPTKKELAYKELIMSLQAAVQRESHRTVLEKFGAPPYRVEMTIRLPSNLNQDLKFTIEMAPLEYMPHAVHVFLEQVAHGLWDRYSFFYVNGPHVVQCGPQATWQPGDTFSKEEERMRALAPFQELQLDTLSFPEYSDQFLHEPWTLGFTGRPGGPDWYINKVNSRVVKVASHTPCCQWPYTPSPSFENSQRNNSDAHCPGGGGSTHELSDEYGDPCFAKVIDGFDSLRSMFSEATIRTKDAVTQFYYEEPVQLIKAEILGWNQQATAEAAAIAASATIEHATGAKVDVNAAIQQASKEKAGKADNMVAADTASNIADAAAKIAANMAHLGETETKAEGAKHGPWKMKRRSENREQLDLDNENSLFHEKSQRGSDLDVAVEGISEAKAKTSDGQSVTSDSGLPQPAGVRDFISRKRIVKDDHVYEGGNIDPEYAESPTDSADNTSPSYLSEGMNVDQRSSPVSDDGEKAPRRKKELMMARSR